jgi:O-antigen ligase
MTAPLLTPARPGAPERDPLSRFPDLVVLGSCLIAPLNLLIVRSFTLYDLTVGAAWLVLVRQGRLVWPHRGYLLAAYVFMFFAVVSAFRATIALEALTQVLQYAFVFFVLLPAVVTVVSTRRRAVTSVALLCIGSLGAIAHAYLVQDQQGSGRVLVFYSENPNRLGYPAAYLLPLLVALWVVARRLERPRRLLAHAAIVLGCYLSLWAVSASGSRSSLLGSAVALLVLVVLRPGLGFRRALARLLVLSVAVVGVGAGLLATGQLPTTLEERITRSLDSTDSDAQSHLVADREHLFDAGVAAFMESPLLGTGLDNFRYVTPRYDIEASQQLPHNLWLQLLVQVGAIGTLAMAALLAVWAADVLGAMRRVDPIDGELLWALAAALAGILTIFLFAPEMLDRHYWLVVALGIAIVRGTQVSGAPKGTRP